MSTTHTRRLIFGALALALAFPTGLAYRQFRRDRAAAYRRVASGGKTLETACGRLEYTEFGQGAPMLMIHGAGGGYDQGEYFARFIGGGYRWIAPSRFGFLGSLAPAGADTELQAGAYACLLDALGVEKAGVVGVSMGGPSALAFAARYPERVTSLALVSAASHAIPPRPAPVAAIFNLFQSDFVFWSLSRLSPEGLLAALGVPAAVQQRLSTAETAQVHAFLRSIEPMGARRSGQLLEQRMSEYDSGQIGNIQAPTLVVHARDDTLVAFEQGEYAAASVPAAQLLPMETGGHLALLFDMNKGTLERLAQFLRQHNPQ